MEAEKTAAFEKLRPLCVALTKYHTQDNVRCLVAGLESTNPAILQDLQEYVLFPLRFILKDQTQSHEHMKEDLLTEVCQCVEFMLSRTCLSRWEVFQDMFTCLTCMLSPPEGLRKAIISEELKLAVVKAFGSLLLKADSSVVQLLFSPPSLPPLGHAVSVLLKLSEMEKSREIQLTAIECLLCLSRADSTCGRKQKVLYGDYFASFLPGISMTLCRVITGDNKQGYAVLSKGLEVWWKIVKLVLGDSFLQQDPDQKKNQLTDPVSEKVRSLIVQRSEDWVKSTGSKLLVLVRKISAVKSHSSWRVRRSLVDWADNLLQSCSSSLSESVPTLLEVLVGHLGDEYPNVASRSRAALQRYQHVRAAADQARPLTQLLEENLHALAVSLPRQIRMADEDEKLCVVNLLNGYLTLLGPSINTLLRSLPHLSRLAMALEQAVELDCHDIKIVEQRTSISGFSAELLTSSQSLSRPRRSFKHFRDDRIEAALMKACRLLGYYGDLNILCDHFLDLCTESSIYKMSATLILNEIVFGSSPQAHTDLDSLPASTSSGNAEPTSIVRMLLDEYLSTCFNLQTTATTSLSQPNFSSPWLNITTTGVDNSSSSSVAALNRNICQLSLCLDGVGKFALVLGQRFQPLLILVLYPLLEKLGHENAMICHSAHAAILDVCRACGYGTIADLIHENTDYLMNAISLRLRHLEANLQSPLVLVVILQYSRADILPLIDDTVQEILSCLDDHYGIEAALFMRVLHELTKAINRWFPAKEQTEVDNQTKTSSCHKDGTREEKNVKSVLEICKFFEEYHRQKLIAEGDISKEDYEDVTPGNVDDADAMESYVDEEAELPKHVTAIKEILTRTKHLLSSSNPRLRLLVLDIISQAVQALHDRKNVLLPLMHQLWQPFALRFSDEEKLVTIKAIQTLLCICEASGDFLRKRLFKDVLPKLNSFLRNQAQISAGSSQAYLFTVNYKLQLAYLHNIGDICRLVEAQELDVESVASGCLPYLSCQQPRTLQEACLKTFEQLMCLEPDALWLRLCDLYLPSELSPPGSEFKSVKMHNTAGQSNEYSDNVIKLLPLISTEPS